MKVTGHLLQDHLRIAEQRSVIGDVRFCQHLSKVQTSHRLPQSTTTAAKRGQDTSLTHVRLTIDRGCAVVVGVDPSAGVSVQRFGFAHISPIVMFQLFIDSGGYLRTTSLRALIAAWMNAFR